MNLPLQYRQFALGEVNLLWEFTTMHEDLRAKRASILNSKMPSDLLTNLEPETSQQYRPKNPPANAAIDVDITPKILNWHRQTGAHGIQNCARR